MKTTAPAMANAIETILDAASILNAPRFSEAKIVHSVVDDFGNKGLLTAPLAGVASATGETDASVEMLRNEFRLDLGLIATGRISRGLRTKIYYEADRVVLVPITSEAEVEFRIFPESLEAVTNFVLKLLVKGPYGNDLKQCQLKECGRFFFVSVRRQESGKKGTGRNPDKYCSEAHMMVAHRERATAATIRRRRELKEQREAKRNALLTRKQEKQR